MVIGCIRPNPKYTTMMEETMAYLALDEMGRDDISRVKGIMGPGKMAKFVTLVTNNIIEKKWKWNTGN